jgi:hypothetical protein
MTLDQQLLKRAREQAAQYADAERRAQLARADYHSAVRRVHLAGAPVREIADALGVSHQRVHQMVSAAGGTWWQRVWHSRTLKRDTVCTFCERPPSEVARLIAGPNVFICDRCVALAEKVAADSARRGAMAPARRVTARCSFCRRHKRAGRKLIAGNAAAVCGECLAVCRRILEERGSP